jgi:hypothetical protein
MNAKQASPIAIAATSYISGLPVLRPYLQARSRYLKPV